MLNKIQVLVLLTVSLFSAVAFSKQAPNILILNSYHPQYKKTELLTKGIVDTLETVIPSENVHIKHLNARRFTDDEEYERLQFELLSHEVNQIKPAVVITTEDYAYQFAAKYKSDLFPDTAIVFSGIDMFIPELQQNNSTGIVESHSIESNLHLIVDVLPEVEKIVILGDTSSVGFYLLLNASQIRRQLQETDKFADINLEIRNKFDFDAYVTEFKQPKQNTAILVLTVHQDTQGNYLSYEQHLAEFAKQISVPIFGMWGEMMTDNSVVGGMMTDPHLHGTNAAKLALQIIDGTKPEQLAVIPSATFLPRFDYPLLLKHQIDTKLLPQSSTLLNKPDSFFEKHKSVLLVSIGILAVLVIINSMLMVNLRQRKVIQKELKRFNKELELKVAERTEELEDRNQQLETAAKKLREFAYEDSLTKLNNRRAAVESLTGLIQRHKIKSGDLSVALIDIDHFKNVNDTYGHEEGDNVLIDIARIMKNIVRPLDGTYRWGGEEFLLLLPNANSEIAQQVCERLRKKIAEHQFTIPIPVTISTGITQIAADDDLDSVVSKADKQLYKAKHLGRNLVVNA